MGDKSAIKRVLCSLLVIAVLASSAMGFAAPAPVSPPPVPSQPDEHYKLSKYDVLNIVVVGFPAVESVTRADDSGRGASSGSVSGNVIPSGVVIGPDGYVNLPFVGSVKLAGLTIPEATVLLTEKLSEYVKIPSLSVMVTAYGPRKVYVMGEVAKQGIYTLGSEYMNVFAALSSAGGITSKGRPKHIAIVRMVNGKVEMQEVDFDRFVKKQDPTQNKLLQDGDMVYVPKSNKIDFYGEIMPIVNSYLVFRSISK